MPLDRLFSNKTVTPRGGTQKSQLKHITFLLREIDNKPTTLQKLQSKPYQLLVLQSHIIFVRDAIRQRAHIDPDIPYNHPFRDERSPHVPAASQPAHLPTTAFVWQSNM